MITEIIIRKILFIAIGWTSVCKILPLLSHLTLPEILFTEDKIETFLQEAALLSVPPLKKTGRMSPELHTVPPARCGLRPGLAFWKEPLRPVRSRAPGLHSRSYSHPPCSCICYLSSIASTFCFLQVPFHQHNNNTIMM